MFPLFFPVDRITKSLGRSMSFSSTYRAINSTNGFPLGLAPLLVQQLRDQILELKAAGLAIFLVEQNLGLALAVADEIYVMESGQIVYHDSPDDLATNERVKHKYLGV